MAKRTKRATARKAKAGTKVAKRAKTTKRRAAKRLVKMKPKRQKPNAKPRRPVAKKSTSRRHRTPAQSTLQTETTIVDVIEESVPGVLVVTEFVETHIKPDTTKPLDIDQTAGPESEEK
jgi:phage repressor protein C with HTH and peptisase S24 domain